MPTPNRITSGFTQDAIWQPLGQIGVPNPAFYHQTFDDFDFYDTNEYTTTTASTGNIAATAADGGAVTLTTAATTSDFESFQRKVAGFAFVPPTASVAGKKTIFLTRIQLNSVGVGGFTVGLMNTSATPFAPTDGVYFTKPINSAVLSLVSNVGSTPVTMVIPAADFTALANNTYVDLGFLYDPSSGKGGPNLFAIVGTNLVGYAPQSGTGATNLGGTPPRQPVASFIQINGVMPALTAVLLNPTIAVQAGTTSVTTLQADFLFAARER
jgi:hypothetical protein